MFRSSQLQGWPRGARMLAALALSAGSAWAAATVSTFTGGDPGEGLDLQGNFTYAVNVGPTGAAGKIGDANFTADNAVGVTLGAQNEIGAWLAATLGDTENDDNLEKVLRSIRWSAAPAVVTVQLRVEKGIEYKLQIIEGEDCCPGRGFNIELNGETIAENVLPGMLQSPNGDFPNEKLLAGVVITHQFTSPSNILTFVVNGPAAPSEEITDRNGILNGFTLERISPVTDNDADGLRDDWEISVFGDLAQTAGGDFDGDGLTNLDEFTLQLDPTNTDTDRDGLTDGSERSVHKTDPASADSDRDGLRDGAEVNVYLTDPAKRDTDGDTHSDYDEVRLFSDPKSAASMPRKTTVGLFTGADPGEGLDLQGNFIFAIDHSTEDAVGGFAGEANFTSELADGLTVTSGFKAPGWNTGIVYGETEGDLVLADVMSSIAWSDAASGTPEVTLTMGNLVPGSSYKIQLLFAEQAWARGFDVYVDDLIVADDFSPAFYQGGGFPLRFPDDRGVVLTHNFVARTNSIRVILDGNGATTPEFIDHNAIINGSTLELTGALVDTDGDSLPDQWEIDYFGNLAQTASQDADGDGLSNLVEFGDGSSPIAADIDGDGLNDSQEKAAGTKPGLKDSDRDQLSDKDEVEIYHTNPAKADSDDDGFSDRLEIQMGGDPNNPVIEVVTTGNAAGPINGGDAGEGLDLDGTFIYAFSVMTNTPATGKVRDAVFTSENVPGVTLTGAPATIANWYRPDFGDTEDDNALERIIGNIRHSGGGVNIKLANLVIGRKYKLQMLFGEACCARGMDIYVDGKLVADEFAPFEHMGGTPNNLQQAAFASYEFTAAKDYVIIQTLGSTVTSEAYTDRNPIINAVTLEDLTGGPVAPPAPVIRGVNRANGVAVTIDSVTGRSYTLQHKARIDDAAWTDVATVAATGTGTTLTDNDAGRQARPAGFYRVRAQ